MFNQIKPGHVLRFGTDPGGIVSPPAVNVNNDNTLETLWPTTSNLGNVQVLSHPGGPIGTIAADVATRLRPGFRLSRQVSYSKLGRAVTPANRVVGVQNCDFVGYTHGTAHYINSANTVFSKDFSGCTMVVYTQAGVRRVAHAAASAVPAMNSKHAFMTTIQGNGAVLIGWFKPFTQAADGARKANAFGVITAHIGGNINRLTTFGVITAANAAYTVDAFKPAGVGYGANDWVVTYIAPCALNPGWVVP
ncbi:MAG: hypothetical protein ACYSU0_08210 [Planctomycetota bacterium]|jgi:hypothetical protein